MRIAAAVPSAASGGSSKSVRVSTSKKPSSLTYADLRECFHLPITDVAKQLGLCTTVLKSVCRKFAIKKWPYRQIRKIDNCLTSLRNAMRGAPSENEQGLFSEQIAALTRVRESVLDDPNSIHFLVPLRDIAKVGRNGRPQAQPKHLGAILNKFNASHAKKGTVAAEQHEIRANKAPAITQGVGPGSSSAPTHFTDLKPSPNTARISTNSMHVPQSASRVNNDQHTEMLETLLDLRRRGNCEFSHPASSPPNAQAEAKVAHVWNHHNPQLVTMLQDTNKTNGSSDTGLKEEFYSHAKISVAPNLQVKEEKRIAIMQSEILAAHILPNDRNFATAYSSSLPQLQNGYNTSEFQGGVDSQTQ